MSYAVHELAGQQEAARSISAEMAGHCFRALFDNTESMAIQGYTADGTVVYWNPASERLYGYTAEEALGGNILDLIIPADMRDEAARAMRRMFQRGQSIPSERLNLRHKNGGRVPVYSSHTLVAVPGHPPVGFCMDADMSALERAEAEIWSAKAEADRANLAKSKFLAAASHDLRQPAQSLQLLVSSVEHYVSHLPQMARTVDVMKTAMDSLNGLLAGILDISRLDAGLLRPNLESVDCGAVVARLAEEYAPVAAAKGLALRSRPRQLHTRTDAALLEQALRNLIENALRYTNRGRILLGVRPRGARIGIEVIDTGIGIPADKHREIFEEFYQVGNPGRDRSQGLGIGLAIVGRVASLLGGEVTVVSQLGRGSRFSVLLPREASPYASAEAQTWTRSGNPMGPRR